MMAKLAAQAWEEHHTHVLSCWLEMNTRGIFASSLTASCFHYICPQTWSLPVQTARCHLLSCLHSSFLSVWLGDRGFPYWLLVLSRPGSIIEQHWTTPEGQYICTLHIQGLPTPQAWLSPKVVGDPRNGLWEPGPYTTYTGHGLDKSHQRLLYKCMSHIRACSYWDNLEILSLNHYPSQRSKSLSLLIKAGLLAPLVLDAPLNLGPRFSWCFDPPLFS